MMRIMMPIPPMQAATSSSEVLFWGMIGLLVALFVLATILWIIGNRRIAQRQTQVKEAGGQYEAFPPFPSEEYPPIRPPQELLPRR
jgi:hypothetical protein